MSKKRLFEVLKSLMPKGNVGSQIVKSLVWVASQNALGRVIQLAMLVVLARIIGPTELGLVGIALLALSALRKFSEIGLNAALIHQKQENVDSYLDTVWLLEIARGILIGVTLFAAAPLIASFFGEPRAEQLLQVIAVVPVIIGLKNPGVVYFQKNLNFHKEFVFYIGSDIIRAVVSVAYALIDPTAWAFVAGFLAGNVTKFILSYFIDDYRPWPRFDMDAAKELIDYGKWMTGSSILFFFTTEGDDAFVGWFLTPAALGLYQYGYRLSNAPATEITQIISRVMFPAFSKLQSDTDRLRGAYLQTLRLVSFVSFPAAFGIAAVTPTFVRAFLGPDWTGMIVAMQILAGYGLLRSIGKTFGPVWKATGRPDIITKLSAFRLVLIAILIYPLTDMFGIAGTALTVTIIYVFPMMPLDLYIIKRTLDATYGEILYEFTYPLIASVIMFAGVWAVHLSVETMPLLKFGLLTLTGVVLYVLSVLLLEIQFNWGIRENITTLISNVKS